MQWNRASPRGETGTSGFLSVSDSGRRVPAEYGQESHASSSVEEWISACLSPPSPRTLAAPPARLTSALARARPASGLELGSWDTGARVPLLATRTHGASRRPSDAGEPFFQLDAARAGRLLALVGPVGHGLSCPLPPAVPCSVPTVKEGNANSTSPPAEPLRAWVGQLRATTTPQQTHTVLGGTWCQPK